VNKTVLIVVFCLVVITGCVISDNSEMDSDRSATTTPVEPAENSGTPTSMVSEPTVLATRAQTFSQEEIRQLQVRLKQVGIDPGPADGVPGARTRAAFGRLQTSCAAWKSISDNSAQRQAGTLDLKFPDSRKDIELVQKRLRTAGFDSGPVDGILGVQTKTVLMAVQNICPKVNGFADYFSAAVSVSEKQRSTAIMFGTGVNSQQSVRPANTGRAPKQTSMPVATETKEEIRILQLRLRDAGFDPGTFDGIMGPQTKAALQQYDASQRGKTTKVSLTTREAAAADY
jgi:peptidoglycan hydrolase-like protein with peptidoglycan-binding domain